MLILSQSGQSLANLDNLTHIRVIDGGLLVGKSSDGIQVFLGKYDEQMAKRILKEIMQFYDDGKKTYIMTQE